MLEMLQLILSMARHKVYQSEHFSWMPVTVQASNVASPSSIAWLPTGE
jgi:hypothetical protein